MGNSTVTPAAPANSRVSIPTTSPIPRRSVSVINFESATEARITPVSSYSRTSVVRVASTIGHISDIPKIPVTSPTFAPPTFSPTFDIPVVSPTFSIPIISPTRTPRVSYTPVVPLVTPPFTIPIVSPNPAVPLVSPNPAVPLVSPTAEIPVESPTPTTPVVSSTPEIPIVAPTPTFPVVSSTHEMPTVTPTAAVPVVSSNPEIPIVSPTPAVPVVSSTQEIPTVTPTPAVPVVSSSSGIPIDSHITSHINGFPVTSPDITAVSPTFDLPNSPRASPTPVDAVIPVKSTISPSNIRSAAPITYDASTSPFVTFAPTPRVISTTSRPTKAAAKRTVSKVSVPPSASTFKQAKPSSPFVQRWDKWNKSDSKLQEKKKRLSLTSEQDETLNKSTTSSKNSQTVMKVTPISPEIVAVPSFLLRSTAVCNPPEENYILSGRTQSVHTDFSIIKYYLPFTEGKQSTGNHTKATMFKMDTRLKETPLPAPSLALLNKNFSDGTRETHDNSPITPSFGSLGLRNDSSIEPIDQSSTELRLHEKQQHRKLGQSAQSSYDNSDNNVSYQFVSQAVMSQPNFSTTEWPSRQNNRQSITSILKKKPSSFSDPYSTEINRPVFQEFQKTDFEDPAYTVSIDLPLPSTKKARQSITRSIKLFTRKK